jgi:ATP-dependent Lhr-like helicase
VPRIALSATFGDLPLAAEFLRPGAGGEASLIEADDDGQELQLQLRGYRFVAPRLNATEAIEAETAGIDVTAEEVTEGDKVAIAEHLFRVLRGADNLVFANTRREVKIYADLLTTMAERAGLPNQFFPHHGSLSKDLREHVEARLKGADQPITAICTSTLEMGIDIGDVGSIAQIGTPPTVASLRQRLGRSGRRGGPAILRIYVAELDITEKTPPSDWLRAELVQSIAMVRLLLSRWIEPPSVEDLHLSTLVQQLLLMIAQHGGVAAPDAYGALCGSWSPRSLEPSGHWSFGSPSSPSPSSGPEVSEGSRPGSDLSTTLPSPIRGARGSRCSPWWRSSGSAS